MCSKWVTVTVLVVLTLTTAVGVGVIMVTPNKDASYLQERDEIILKEETKFFGQHLILTEKELKVDKILLEKKLEELTAAYHNSSNFLPLQHFFQAKDRIDKSDVFAIIRKSPKGASLHTHLAAAVSVDFIVNNISYRDNLYGGYINDVFKLKFLSNSLQDDRCNWTDIKKMRAEKSPSVFDSWLKKQFMLNDEDPRKTYPNIEAVWKRFKGIFSTTYDLLLYKPVYQEFIYQLLQELYDDNVFYVELKGTIMPLYDLNETIYSNQQFFEIFIETINKFKTNHPGFLGAKYIHSIYRGASEETLRTSLEEIIQLKKQFPDFIIGFDLVGFEEEGKWLGDYRSMILQAEKDLKFFAHAGETNWFGHTDLNLVDAILLNSFRIGHGFAITRHPELLKLATERKIPLELCPISNQVLMLNEDHRNHPAVTLMAMDYPLVIGNDDPSVWNATGLSYDWYMVFMAMTSKTSGLEVLKQFAINSITYSAMESPEKEEALEKWKIQWDKFLDDILTPELD